MTTSRPTDPIDRPTLPLLGFTGLLDPVLQADPTRHALDAPSGVLTYEELDAYADAVASALAELGVEPGDRVAACLPNDLDIVVAFHGCMRLGAIWVGINEALADPEKEALLASAAPSVFLAGPEAGALADRGTRAIEAGRWRADEWGQLLTAELGAGRRKPPNFEAPAAIAFTSGTTGHPKGIVHSHRNLLLPGLALVRSRGYDSRLRKGDWLPLTILNLQVLTTPVTALAGGCCVLTDQRDAAAIAEWIGRTGVTVWNGVPALLHSLVHDVDIDSVSLRSLEEVWTGGAGCPENLLEAFEARFSVTVYKTYGLTEAPSVVTIDPIGGPRLAEASGMPLPHLTVHIRGPGAHPMPVGEDGEIVVSACQDGEWANLYTPPLGIWGVMPPATASAETLVTGDIGAMSVEGYLFVKERKSAMILRGGANVYPAEVERVIIEAPGVRSAAVFGVDDARLGQRVAAAIEIDTATFDGVEPLRDRCRANLARYKVPDVISVVDALPRNAMGKVVRARLADLIDEGSAHSSERRHSS